MRKKIFYSLIIILSILIIASCSKKKDNLYGVSISANQMIGTPAEMFSLQHIKMFQASNDFTMKLLPTLSTDTTFSNFALSPFYLLNNLIVDTLFSSYFTTYEKLYSLSSINNNDMPSTINSFLAIVHKIDSTFDLKSEVSKQTKNKIFIKQEMEIPLLYDDNTSKNFDNIFTTYDNKKPRLDYMNISGNFPIYLSDDEQVSEIPIGNGNYILMLIQPTSCSIKDYINKFDEQKYFSLIQNTQERQVNLAFPLINVNTKDKEIYMPTLSNSDSTITFPKKLFVSTSISLRKATMAELSTNVNNKTPNNSVLSKNDSKPIKYDSPFLFIIRGKNSNLIMLIGWYLSPQK